MANTRTGQSQYGMCDKCGADNVMNPRTGNIFCAEKCWLKGQPQQPRTQFVRQGGNLQVKKEPNWPEINKEKVDNINLLNARNNAVSIAISLYEKGDITSEMILPKVAELTEKIKQIGNGGNN